MSSICQCDIGRKEDDSHLTSPSFATKGVLEKSVCMDIFSFRDHLIDDYSSYVQSFIQIRNPQIQSYVQGQLKRGVLWPDPLIQLSPLFESGASIDALVAEGVLHPECGREIGRASCRERV